MIGPALLLVPLLLASRDRAPAAAPAWEVHQAGSGVIDDVLTGRTVRLPFERRVHVAIVPEGFTEVDLAQGRFEREIERWLEEVLRVEPLSLFREAFVVWKRALASVERLAYGAPQRADTALRLPITPDGYGVARVDGDGPTAERLWRALRDFPVPLSFFGPGGQSHRLARNLVVVIAALDPRTGAAGFSGRAVPLRDPIGPERRVATAIALGRAHEFGHAFALLDDEYMARGSIGVDNVQAAAASVHLSNVVARARCDELPWKHLLHGGRFNPHTPDLVGAFGDPARGFHPELKCLMNGTHDNARYFGGDGRLRSMDRMCNFCREVATFRLLERTGILSDQRTSLTEWTVRYRPRFYERYGFKIPDRIPQTNSDGEPWFQDCLR